MVRLLFKESTENLSFKGSFGIAKKFLNRIDARFSKDHEYVREYHKFFLDYRELGHMEVSKILGSINLCYFIPQHGILYNGRFRSVFNGAAKDFNKVSINDLLHCGANLLADLAELLIGWMSYKYVFVSDIEHMYRQINWTIRMIGDFNKFYGEMMLIRT